MFACWGFLETLPSHLLFYLRKGNHHTLQGCLPHAGGLDALPSSTTLLLLELIGGVDSLAPALAATCLLELARAQPWAVSTGLASDAAESTLLACFAREEGRLQVAQSLFAVVSTEGLQFTRLGELRSALQHLSRQSNAMEQERNTALALLSAL
jgi:hypothetical protein